MPVDLAGKKRVREAVRLSLEEDPNGRPVNDCRTCWSARRRALQCPKPDPNDPAYQATGDTLCRVPALEDDPWTLAVLRASNIDPGLHPSETCAWFGSLIETAKAERGRSLKERMRANRG